MLAREQSAYRLAKLIKRARRQMANAIRERLEPIGTSLPVVQIIRRVAGEGRLNQLELARLIEVEPAALCRLLVELESKGLVVRQRDSADHRRVLVAATVEGEELLERAEPHVLGGVEEMVSRLSRAEQADLCRLLEKLAPEPEDEHAADRDHAGQPDNPHSPHSPHPPHPLRPRRPAPSVSKPARKRTVKQTAAVARRRTT